MKAYEVQYRELVRAVLNTGEKRESRNGGTLSVFGRTLTVDLQEGFPLLQGRQIFYRGVLGELAAMLRGPTTIKDFEDQGCNYWALWGKEDGTINIDYGTKWLDWNGYNQLETVLEAIKTNPHDRRLIINSWDPSNLKNLDLPCCHYAYQWYVRDGKYLDMLWHQRSVDTMIGLPSDVVFAAAWLIAMSKECGLEPGVITFTLGDTHIYDEHKEGATTYLENSYRVNKILPLFVWHGGNKTTDFKPDDIEIISYKPLQKINFKLKA